MSDSIATASTVSASALWPCDTKQIKISYFLQVNYFLMLRTPDWDFFFFLLWTLRINISLNVSLLTENKNSDIWSNRAAKLNEYQELVKLEFTLQSVQFSHVLKGQACVTRSSIHFVGYVALHHHPIWQGVPGHRDPPRPWSSTFQALEHLWGVSDDSLFSAQNIASKNNWPYLIALVQRGLRNTCLKWTTTD